MSFGGVIDTISKRAYEGLSAGSVGANARVVLDFVVLQQGGIVVLDRKPEKANSEDVFYCEQALWDGAPYTNNLECFHLSRDFDRSKATGAQDDVAKYYLKHDDLKSKSVVIHLIPTYTAKRYPGIFSDSELHDLNNLEAISIEKINSRQLQGFREEWNDFFVKFDSVTNTKPSRRDILSAAHAIYGNYESLFVHPVTAHDFRWRKPGESPPPSH